MFKKSRLVLGLGLVLALGVAALAWGTTADENNQQLVAAAKPAKGPEIQPKVKATKHSLDLAVKNQEANQGTSEHSEEDNPASEEISIDEEIYALKGIGKTPECPTAPPNGQSAEAFKASCPAGAILGEGSATTVFPPPLGTVNDIKVTAAHGPAGAQPPSGRRASKSEPLILHTESATLKQASPVVRAYQVKSRAGKKFDSTLWVPSSPKTGPGLITEFGALIPKSNGVIRATCDDGKWFFLRKTVYNDGSSEQVKVTQKCKTQS